VKNTFLGGKVFLLLYVLIKLLRTQKILGRKKFGATVPVAMDLPCGSPWK